MRALVVGAGISGLACAGALHEAGWSVQVRDRGRAVGGRLASRRLVDTGTRFDGRIVDHGASYFTARDERFRAVVDAWCAAGVLRPWTDAFHVAGPDGLLGVRSGPMRYAAPRGLRSVAEHLAAGLRDVRTDTTVERIEGTRADGEEFDAVAVCMPGPQAARLVDVVPAAVDALTWEPVIAVVCVFAERTWPEIDGVFVNDDPVLTWIADDGRRRGDDAPVLVAHVHPLLSALHLDDPDAVLAPAVAAVQRVLGISATPDCVQAHRWSFARPVRAEAEPFALEGRVGFAGDGFADGPRVETAWLSGAALGRHFVET